MAKITCSELALNESLAGTATQNACHFVLAIPRHEWKPKIKEMEGLVGTFSRLIEELPPNQVLLTLRVCEEKERGEVWLFPHCFRFTGLIEDDYPDLIAQALNGNFFLPYEAVTERDFVLVCTHGNRDICCAKKGTPVWRALENHAPPHMVVWESSHLGGHRFAATLVVHPADQWYGRLRPENIPDLLQALDENRVLTEFYRGSPSYSPPLQVAETWGWEQLEAWGQIGRISLVNPQIEEHRAVVEVSIGTEHDSITYKLTLEAEKYQYIGSCGDTEKGERLVWRVVKTEPFPYDGQASES